MCPTGALAFGDLDDPASRVSRLIASGNTESQHPEYKLNEKVVYIGLPKKFVAGTVVYGDTDECAAGAAVSLVGSGKRLTEEADTFGDFEFEGLADNADCTVKIESKGYKSKEIPVKTGTDIYLGVITLQQLFSK